MGKSYIIFYCISLIHLSSVFAETGVLKIEKKGSTECRKLYPAAQAELESVNEGNALESAHYFKCVADFMEKGKFLSPHNVSQSQHNQIVENSIAKYSSNYNYINSNYAFVRRIFHDSVVDSPAELTNTKIIIKSFGGDKIELAQTPEIAPPQTLEQAEERCVDKGFKKQSFDSLEAYLFSKCLREEGFDTGATVSEPSTNYKGSTVLKRYRDGIKRKSNIKTSTQASQKPATHASQKLPEPVLSQPVKATTSSDAQPSQDSPSTKEHPSPEAPPTALQNKKPSKLKCTNDEAGNRICVYNPQFKSR